MTIKEMAEKYSVTEQRVKDLVNLDERHKTFFANHINEHGEMDILAKKAIEEILQADNEAEEPYNTKKTEKHESTDEKEVPVSNEKKEDMENPKVSQNGTRKRRQAKKTETTVSIPSASVPPSYLRKFYYEHFKASPEKIFLLSDEEVKEKVLEKYFVLENEAQFLFIKKGTGVLAMLK